MSDTQSPPGSANTCGFFDPTDSDIVYFGSTLVPPTATEPPGYSRSGRYKWMFPAEMRIVRTNLASADRSLTQADLEAAARQEVDGLPRRSAGAIGFAALGVGQEALPMGSFGYVNIIAVMAITAMSFITAPFGAKAAHALNAPSLKRIFGVYLVVTSAIVLWNSFS